MQLGSLTEAVYESLQKQGHPAKIISIEHVHDLQKDIETQHIRGLFDEEFYSEKLTGFDFQISKRFPEAKSLIIAAASQPQLKVTFSWDGKSYPCIIPPTYSYETDRKVQRLLEQQLMPEGYRLEIAKLPWKLLAVRSGLAQYGKNNITYIQEMGSYYRLVAFISDLPCLEDSWTELETLKLCRTCKACLKACPASAIASDRFLLHGERCLTFHNERRGKFPKWIHPSWHNCLVGCLYCQTACPVNKDVISNMEAGPSFSEKETAYLLQRVSKNKNAQNMITKLEKIDVIEYLSVLGRNLQALIHNQIPLS